MGVVIVHAEMGIYLGSCFGLGFWSVLDCAGQDTACTFKDEIQAREYVASWESNSDPNSYRYVTVETVREWASIEELQAAHLGDYLETMRIERLRNIEPAGRA